MPDPISSVSYRDATWADPDGESELHDHVTRQIDGEIWGACRNPDGVVGAIACDNHTAASNACRRAKPGSLDETLCDDKKMEKAQDGALWIVQKAIDYIISAKMGGAK